MRQNPRDKQAAVEGRPSLVRRLLKTALYMVLMGILCGWVLVYAVPVAIQWEFAVETAKRLPLYGLYFGAALGLGMGVSNAIKHGVFNVLLAAVFGAFLWLCSIFFVGPGLLLIGIPEETVDRIMDWVGPGAFVLGVSLAGFVALVVAYEKAGALLERFRSKGH